MGLVEEILLGEELALFNMIEGCPESDDVAVGFEGEAELLIEVPVDLARAPENLFGELLHRQGAVVGENKIKQFFFAGVDGFGEERVDLSGGCPGKMVEGIEVFIGELPVFFRKRLTFVQYAGDGRLKDVFDGQGFKADGEHFCSDGNDGRAGFCLDAFEDSPERRSCRTEEEQVNHTIWKDGGFDVLVRRVLQHPEALDEVADGIVGYGG